MKSQVFMQKEWWQDSCSTLLQNLCMLLPLTGFWFPMSLPHGLFQSSTDVHVLSCSLVQDSKMASSCSSPIQQGELPLQLISNIECTHPNASWAFLFQNNEKQSMMNEFLMCIFLVFLGRHRTFIIQIYCQLTSAQSLR